MPLSPTVRTWLLRIGSFLLAGILLYFALRNADLEAVGAALRDADYRWLLPVLFITLLSHWLRAMRWGIMLDALPGQDRRTSRLVGFLSIMIGYMANYAGPRVGELVRSGNMAAHERIPFSSMVGTVVAERVLDVLTLALALLTLPLLYGRRLWTLSDTLFEPLSGVSTATWVIILAVLVVGGSVAVWILFFRVGSESTSRISGLVGTFRQGLLSVVRTGRGSTILLLTAAIWTCYATMAYVPFAMLHQTAAYGISPIDAWGLMLLGSLGVVIPAPGGIGTFHLITIQSLALLYGMPESDAATYALLTHTGQMILYVLVGFIAIIYLGGVKRVPASKR